jgi:hypothetical protein
MNNNQIIEDYKRRTVEHYNYAAVLRKKVTIISFLRLFVFIGGIVLSVASFSFGPVYGAGAVIISVSAFLFLVKLYIERSDEADFSAKMATINLNEAVAMTGDWSSFDQGEKWIDTSHEFSNDIDLFGKDSLFQYLNRTFTGYGRSVLAGWLSSPFSLAGKTRERQEAVRELSGLLEWRQKFIANGVDKSLEISDIESLLVWLNRDEFVFTSPARKVLVFALPALAVLTLGLVIAGLIPYPVFVSFFLLNLMLTGIALRKTNRIHQLLSRKFEFLSSISRLLTLFEGQQFNSLVLTGIRSVLTGGPASAAIRIKQLSGVIRSFDSRLNVFAGFLLNGLILWDFHCIRVLEKWKKASAADLPGWLESCGEIEAYCSLAGFSYNNQGFAWPVPAGDGTIIDSKQMGHPLISEDVRVCNDFSVPSPGKIVIITGANMAGKSTFLRTVAVNMILAMNGAPVCASEMRFSPVRLFTSMRTTDSLSQSESYFYAELKRLKTLKERLKDESGVFFILDEILKGTNSADKSTGSKLFLKKLAELGASGMIATHDTSLGEMEKEHPGTISNKCFEIEIDGDRISFDYRLRNGITTRMNAAILMKEMGITD